MVEFASERLILDHRLPPLIYRFCSNFISTRVRLFAEAVLIRANGAHVRAEQPAACRTFGFPCPARTR